MRALCSALPLAWASAPAYAQTPLSYLTGFGTKTNPTAALIWGVIAISTAVFTIVGLLVLVGLLRRPALRQILPGNPLPVMRASGGMSWIWIGLSISMLALLFTVIWTMVVLANIVSPGKAAPFQIEITGHQWWWEVLYKSKDVSRSFETANEIHIPVGVPVKFKLRSADVIHSFWVPALTGKTDLIPGQTNLTWMEANKPGTYDGQCSEYCGVEHARMALRVIADEPKDFQQWWSQQLRNAQPHAGQDQFVAHCGGCHAVRGTDAGGIMGPDLSHLMMRGTIAAGMLSNTPGNLSGWIADPQAIKPGAKMPVLMLSGPELASIRNYLETLK